VLIAEKLGVSQPTVSEHLKVLAQAGLLDSKRIKQWTFYKRNEGRIAELKRAIVARISDWTEPVGWARARLRRARQFPEWWARLRFAHLTKLVCP
jgi:DNA-binding transcriptional ArsR family regulator